MNPKLLTNLFLVFWIATAIIYDLIIFTRCGREATITHILAQWVEDYPVLLIALGALVWHLWGKGK